MATIRSNGLVSGFKGSISGVMFRQLNGKTVVSAKPSRPKKQSVKQVANRHKFREATVYAKASMLIPERKTYYTMKAKKLKLPNAYTAAITDYMRKGEIQSVDTKGYKGKSGDLIRVRAGKKDFNMKCVKVTVIRKSGEVIEMGEAMRKDREFVYKATSTLLDREVFLEVLVYDYAGNVVRRRVEEGLKFNV